MKALEKLTFEGVTLRAVSIPMRRPIVAKVGTYPEWPFILIDVKTDNYAQSAQLASELKTPVQIGENIYGPRSFLDAVRAEAADLYMPDLMRIGGVTGWMRAAAIAGAAGHPMSSHLYPEVSAHLLCATETADWLEYRDWGNPIIKEPFQVKDGQCNVPDRPGNGIEWDEGAVGRFAY